MTEHFYNISFEGLCLSEKDLKKLLQKIEVCSDAQIDLETLPKVEIFKKYQHSETQLTDALDVLNILTRINISAICYDGSGTFLGGE